MKWVYSNQNEKRVAQMTMLQDLERDALNADSAAIGALSNKIVALVKTHALNNVEAFIALYTAIETLASDTPKAMKAAFNLNGSSLENLKMINQSKVVAGIAGAMADEMTENLTRQVFGVAPEPTTLTEDELIEAIFGNDKRNSIFGGKFALGGRVEGTDRVFVGAKPGETVKRDDGRVGNPFYKKNVN